MNSKIVLLLSLLFSFSSLYSQVDIKITTIDGVSIYLNDNLISSEPEAGELLIKDFIAGEYILKMEKEGYETIEKKIKIEGETFEYKMSLEDFTPIIVEEELEEIILEVEDEEMDEAVFFMVEQMPVFRPDICTTTKEGEVELQKFIGNNVKYPKVAMKKEIQGRVYISFVVDKKGKVTKVKVLRKVDPLLDAEAIRVISMLPDFKPGMQRGKPVPVQFNVPIGFKLGKKKVE